MNPRIAIIGAGISGLTLARALQPYAKVTVFEKSRGVGGRMSTRYAEPFAFDHGTQYFTARGRPFREFLAPYQKSGVVSEWVGKVVTLEAGKEPSKRLWFEPHFIANPNMNSLCKTLADGLEVKVNTEVAPLVRGAEHGWTLKTPAGEALGLFDWVISTAPPVQTAALLGEQLVYDAPLRQVALQGCYALMLGFAQVWDQSWIAAKINHPMLSWVSVNNTKPGRNPEVTSLLVHARNDWSEAHIDEDMEAMQRELVAAFAAVSGLDCTKPDFITTHRWRYAQVGNPLRPGVYLDATRRLAAASDWAMGSRIEEAWLAAQDLAEKLVVVLKG